MGLGDQNHTTDWIRPLASQADAARWEQQGPKKKMTGSDEMDFVKQMTSNGKARPPTAARLRKERKTPKARNISVALRRHWVC